MWLRGYVAIRPCSCVAMWLCGYICFYFHLRESPPPHNQQGVSNFDRTRARVCRELSDIGTWLGGATRRIRAEIVSEKYPKNGNVSV